MTARIGLVACALALRATAPTAFAAIVNEIETDGTSQNNTLAAAQGIPTAAFTLPLPPTVFSSPGGPTATVLGRLGTGSFPLPPSEDIDFYSFTTSATRAYFDIDLDPFAFDSMLSLFDSTGTLIGFADDSCPPEPGSASCDSFLGIFPLPAPGTYTIAVTESSNAPNGFGPATGFVLTRPDGADGGFRILGAQPGNATFPSNGPQPDGARAYTLHITLVETTAIPEPAAWWLTATGVGAVLLRRKPRLR
jgi:hypothetical protein